MEQMEGMDYASCGIRTVHGLGDLLRAGERGERGERLALSEVDLCAGRSRCEARCKWIRVI